MTRRPTTPEWRRNRETIGLRLLKHDVGEGENVRRPLDEFIRQERTLLEPVAAPPVEDLPEQATPSLI